MKKAIAFKRHLLIGVMLLFVAIFVIPGRGLANLTDGLVGYWSFDEGGDTVAHDATTNNNHGTIYGSPNWVAGISGSALQLDGINDYVDVPNSASLNPPNAITLAAWYKPVSFEGTGNDPIIDKAYVSHTNPWYQYHLGVCGDQYSPDKALFGFDVATGDVWNWAATGEHFWTPGTWYFLTGTYDGSAVKLYVNGGLISQDSANGTITDYDKPVYFGKYVNRDKYLPGTIDEVRIYNRALSEAEIESLYCGRSYIPRGDANRDGVINVTDVVYLINYLFLVPPGPAPQPWAAGDVNCDCVINASDVVYLINYLYIGGPPPGC